MRKDYQIAELEPYINWLYFYHAWGLSGKPREEKEKLRKEAEQMLHSWQGCFETHALFGLFEAESEGDDLLLYLQPEVSSEKTLEPSMRPSVSSLKMSVSSEELDVSSEKMSVSSEKMSVPSEKLDDSSLKPSGSSVKSTLQPILRFPMLRQQHPAAPGEPNLCLADFILPRGRKPKADDKKGIANHVGVFCTTVDAAITEQYRHDEYLGMMAQTLCDRLAEATAEKLHKEVRREIWGYAPDEQLTIEQQHREEYQGIRPAIGYPSLPDTSANFIIDQLLDMKQVGIRLTETGMMTPHASVSGLMFAHPLARYFELGKIGIDQLRDYAHRRGVPVELMRRFLQSSLMKK